MKIDKMKITKMKKTRIALLLAAGTIAAVTARTSAMIPEQVKIETGLLSPARPAAGQPTVRVFKGIPFAAPPLGENRWRAPQPAAKWDGVRNADAFGAPCTAGAPSGGAVAAAARVARAAPRPAAPPAQLRRRASRRAAKTACTSTSGPARSSPSDRRPVMVWIYGGGFTGGSGGMAWYDGENLAAKGSGHRHVQLPPRLARLLRASRAGEGIGPQRAPATTG